MVKPSDPTGDALYRNLEDLSPEEVAWFVENEMTPEEWERSEVVLRMRQIWERDQPKPILTIRCSAPRRKGKCRTVMGEVFLTELGYYVRHLLVPFVESNVLRLAGAHEHMASGRPGFAARHEVTAGERLVSDFAAHLQPADYQGEWFMACPQHGNVTFPSTIARAAVDARRPVLNIDTLRKIIK